MDYPPILAQIRPNDNAFYPFERSDFNGLPPWFVENFMAAFITRYDGRRIGCQTPSLFRNWCRNIIFEKKGYYSDLLKTIGMIENPFINESVSRAGSNNSAQRNQNLANTQHQNIERMQHNEGGLNTTISGRQKDSLEGNETSQNTVKKGKSEGRNSDDSNKNTTRNNFFSDTPQQPIQVTNEDGTKGPWDQDYLTDARLETERVTTGENKFSASASTDVDNLKSFSGSTAAEAEKEGALSTNASNQEGHTHQQTTDNSIQVGVSVMEGNQSLQTKGLKGVLVSDALGSFRKQLFPILTQFVDEFTSFFLRIYDDGNFY